LKAEMDAQTQAKEVLNDNRRPEDIHSLCLVSDRLIDRVDELGRMLNSLSSDRMPRDPGTAAESETEENGPVACDALVQRIEVLTSRLGNTIAEHEELWVYSEGQYLVYSEFKKRLNHETH
jgi:hypothetical protein